MRRLAAGAVLLVLLAPSSGTAAQTARLTIMHVVQNCHIWKNGAKSLGPAARLTVARGTRIVLRSDCPMDFDIAQVKGLKVALGDPRLHAGQSKTLVFRKAGTYRFTAANVQTPEERGLVVLGQANTLSLVVVVR